MRADQGDVRDIQFRFQQFQQPDGDIQRVEGDKVALSVLLLDGKAVNAQVPAQQVEFKPLHLDLPADNLLVVALDDPLADGACKKQQNHHQGRQRSRHDTDCLFYLIHLEWINIYQMICANIYEKSVGFSIKNIMLKKIGKKVVCYC